MIYRLTFEEAGRYIDAAMDFVPPEYGEKFALWLLDLMSFDDNGVILYIPDVAPQPWITYH